VAGIKVSSHACPIKIIKILKKPCTSTRFEEKLLHDFN